MSKKLNIIFLIIILISKSTLFSQELTIWHTENDPLTITALDTIGKRFSRENNGIVVKYLSIGWDDLYRKLTLAIEGKEVPDLTQLEPFMAAYFYKNDLLLPLDDVISQLDENDIFPVVKDLQLFDGKRYGIATALGISYYSYRKDFVNEPGSYPKTWEEYKEYVSKKIQTGVNAAPLLLPANDLHITLLFTELLASNNGSLFNEKGEPDFSNPKVIETLKFWKELYDLVPTQFKNSPYKENFSHYANGESFSLPCFFGRGTLQIERSAEEKYRSPNSFDIFPHIVGPSGNESFATLDAEPWVILKNSQKIDLAKKYINFFYRKDNYLLFCQSVPIHLTPIFQSLANSIEYKNTPLVIKWSKYHDYELDMLNRGRVLPIFMSNINDRFLPALFKLEGTKVISTMVRDVTQNGLSLEQAVNKAMLNAKELEPEVKSRDITIYIVILILIIVVILILLFLRKRK